VNLARPGGHAKKKMGGPQVLPVVVAFKKIGGQAKTRLHALLAPAGYRSTGNRPRFLYGPI
jgi:hypothetical protein